MERDAGFVEERGGSIAAVDDAERMVDVRAELAELAGRDHDLAAGGDHVFDDGETSADDVGSLGELGGAVGLRFTADVGGRQPGLEGEGGRQRDAPQLEAGEDLGALWDEGCEAGDVLAQESGDPGEAELASRAARSSWAVGSDMPGS